MHGHTAEERLAYFMGKEAGAKAHQTRATLPTAAELNEIAQRVVVHQNASAPQAWKQSFENGYTDAFAETRPEH